MCWSVFCTWQLSQKTRWRWPCRHTADTILSLCAQSESSDTPDSVYPRSMENRQRGRYNGRCNGVRNKLVASNKERGKTRGLQKVMNVGHGENGPLSGVSAPFSLTVLNIQVFPASASAICTHTQKPPSLLPSSPLCRLFPCLPYQLVLCNLGLLMKHRYLNRIVPKATDDLVVVVLETVNSFTIFWATLNPL